MKQFIKAALVGAIQDVNDTSWEFLQPQFARIDELPLTPESQFLLKIGNLATCQRAGTLPAKVAAIPTAPVSGEARISDALEKIICFAMQKEYQDLLPEFLSTLVKEKITISTTLIPQLLQLNSSAERDLIRQTVGEQGKWLSQFNPDWAWVTESNEVDETLLTTEAQQDWETGTFAERLSVLQQIRQSDPQLALQLLQDTFQKEKAEYRREFLKTLSVGLSGKDQSFLESVLSDRSKLVRQVAGQLLSRLPDSSVAERNWALARQWVRIDTGKGGKTALHCSPPSSLPDDWEKLGFGVKPPVGQGQKSFWTEELLARISLNNWEAEFELSPVELINGILNDKYAHAVITGWTGSFIYNGHEENRTDWQLSLWKYWTAMLQHSQKSVVEQATEQLKLICETIELEKRERLIQQLLMTHHDPSQLPIQEILSWLTRQWSKSMSVEYLNLTRQLIVRRSDRAAVDWLNSLMQAAQSLSPESFAAALTPWKINEQYASTWQVANIERQIADFQQCIQLRFRFYEEVDLCKVP